MAAPQKGLRNAASALARRKGLLLPALLLAVAAVVLYTVFAHRAALADALLTHLQATSSNQRPAASGAGQVPALPSRPAFIVLKGRHIRRGLLPSPHAGFFTVRDWRM